MCRKILQLMKNHLAKLEGREPWPATIGWPVTRVTYSSYSGRRRPTNIHLSTFNRYNPNRCPRSMGTIPTMSRSRMAHGSLCEKSSGKWKALHKHSSLYRPSAKTWQVPFWMNVSQLCSNPDLGTVTRIAAEPPGSHATVSSPSTRWWRPKAYQPRRWSLFISANTVTFSGCKVDSEADYLQPELFSRLWRLSKFCQ